MAQSRNADTFVVAIRPELPVTVRWPWLDGTAPIAADVVGWLPPTDGDLAFLALGEDRPAEAKPARFSATQPQAPGSAFPGDIPRLRVLGCPGTRSAGQRTEVRIVDMPRPPS